MEEPREAGIALVAEREAEMASPSDPLIPIKRAAWFVDPDPAAAPEVSRSPPSPSMIKSAPLAHLRESKVLFRGWGTPLRRWGDWVDKLRPAYGDLWKKSGISDAIAVSTYKIKKDHASLLGVAAFWCAETGSFVLPWGEATVTLEDVMVLGGYSVLGETVRGSLAVELAEIEQRMIREHRTFNRSTSKKADQSAWMRHYMEGKGDELEHIAFLALWLSRFVFPGPPVKTVKQHMLSIAIRLARGVRIALGPSVLASIYRDLGAMKDYLVLHGSQKVEPFVVWAPFNLLQLWLWEHFLSLRPDKQNLIDNCEPRAARWHDVCRKSDSSFVHSALVSAEFLWRPYTVSLENWKKPSFYKDIGVWISGDAAKDEEVRSFAQCLRAAELVGVDCIEHYMPHRVAMQLGLDQDVPCHIPRSNSKWEVAWETYDITNKSVAFYIPAQFSNSGITLQYSIWWKEFISSCSKLVEDDIQPHGSLENVNKTESKEVSEKTMKKIHTSPSTKKRKLEEFYDSMLSDCLVSANNSVSGDNESVESEYLQPGATGAERLDICVEKQYNHMKLKPSADCIDKIRYNPEASQSVRLGISKTSIITSLVNEEDGLMMGDFHKRIGLGSADCYVVSQQFGVNIASQEIKMKLEQSVERRIMMKAEESELEMQIKMLKEEIAAMEARVMELEPLAEPPAYYLGGHHNHGQQSARSSSVSRVL